MAVGDNITYILLHRQCHDIDNDSFIFYLDNESANGATLTLNDNTTGNFTYIADAGPGLDNFSYYVIDNYSVPSNTGYVFIEVVEIDPAPAYNVDNFSVMVDNGSTITNQLGSLP